MPMERDRTCPTKTSQSITRAALHWTPDGKRKRGRSKPSLRRTIESETRGSIMKVAQDRQEWRKLLAALHTPPSV
jgi:hypothetical protein